jgi:hypothetical protein
MHHITIFPDRGSSIAVNIYRNSEVVGQVYSYISSPDFSGTSMVAVLSMTIGDVTFIRTSPTTTSSGSIYSDGNKNPEYTEKITDLRQLVSTVYHLC